MALPNALVQQAVIEVMTIASPNARIQQAVIELMVLPTTLTGPFSVILRGVKRYPVGKPTPICANETPEEDLKKLTEFIG